MPCWVTDDGRCYCPTGQRAGLPPGHVEGTPGCSSGLTEYETPTRIGPHRLLCGDLTAGAVASLMGDERADVVYSDPPWGQSLLTAFASAAGVTPLLPWRGFLDAFAASIAEHRNPVAPVFVEMGVRWLNDLDAAMADAGLPMRRRWSTTYGSSRSPATVALYGPTDVAVALPDPPHGEPVTRAILSAVVLPGTIVLDPCTGLGMTARITHKLGGGFRGVELVAKRLERTASWLRRAVPKEAWNG